MKNLKNAKHTLLILSAILLIACSSETPKEETMQDIITMDSTIIDESPVESYSLPSPLKIASIFKKSGLRYKDGVTSQLKDPDKYLTSLSKALNLGVYSADLAYCILNKQNQEVIEYLNLSRKLAENLGMGVIFKKNNLINRFEKNIGKEDSLVMLVSEQQMVMDIYLNDNNQKHITSVAFAGAWIEIMYIASKAHGSDNEKVFNEKYSEQMSILGSIISALHVEEKKYPDISTLIKDLQEIKNSYDDLLSAKRKPDVSENEFSDEPTLTNIEVVFLAKKIETLRTKFING